jgi:hypothetical protein
MNMIAAKKKIDANPMAGEVETLRLKVRPRLARLMGYYRNPISELSEFLPSRGSSIGVRPYRQYQEIGLPARITGFRSREGGEVFLSGSVETNRREVVIENDIAWRMHTTVDFTCGQSPVIASAAKDPATRARLTAVISRVIGDSGGAALLQQLVLEAAVHGSAYLVLQPRAEVIWRMTKSAGDDEHSSRASSDEQDADAATPVRLGMMSAARVAPKFADGEAIASGAAISSCAVLSEEQLPAAAGKGNWIDRVGSWVRAAVGVAAEKNTVACEVWEAERLRKFAGDVVVSDTANPLGFVPVFGFINQADAAGAAIAGLGISDVEPLLPLQDELNTRLSDRANRVTLQSFRMYLGKGIEDFSKRPVGPGQMWSTDNPDASIAAFGGDAEAPSEAAHINEVREALDKISGVTPVAAGLLRGKVGNLTSAVALRVTLIALLARVERKRAGLALTLGAAMRRVFEILDRAGIEKSSPEDREIEITWPSPIPENMTERLREAQMKIGLGVPRGVVLAELGYDEVEVEKGGSDGGEESGREEGGTGAEGGGGEAGAADAGHEGDGGVSAAAAQ